MQNTPKSLRRSGLRDRLGTFLRTGLPPTWQLALGLVLALRHRLTGGHGAGPERAKASS